MCCFIRIENAICETNNNKTNYGFLFTDTRTHTLSRCTPNLSLAFAGEFNSNSAIYATFNRLLSFLSVWPCIVSLDELCVCVLHFCIRSFALRGKYYRSICVWLLMLFSSFVLRFIWPSGKSSAALYRIYFTVRKEWRKRKSSRKKK